MTGLSFPISSHSATPWPRTLLEARYTPPRLPGSQPYVLSPPWGAGRCGDRARACGPLPCRLDVPNDLLRQPLFDASTRHIQHPDAGYHPKSSPQISFKDSKRRSSPSISWIVASVSLQRAINLIACCRFRYPVLEICRRSPPSHSPRSLQPTSSREVGVQRAPLRTNLSRGSAPRSHRRREVVNAGSLSSWFH